jgi:CelD/BcsL family acetyltransferase involved in cellulose biosynthesis
VEHRAIPLHARGAPSWRALTQGQSPLADATWISCFVDAFGGPATLHALTDGERIVAAMPLVRGDGFVRAWTSLDNEHHPYWLVSGRLDEAGARRLLGGVLAGADNVFLRRLPMRDPACLALVGAARSLRLPTVQLESEAGDARIVLDGTWPELRARLPKNFQRDLPRKQRQLERQARLELHELVDPGPALDATLAECFELETRGWKGRDGSPILRDPRTHRFYAELARRLASTGRFVLYTLVLDGAIIAFEYCLRGGGHIEMLKLSFDPAFEKQSPGQVLRMLLLEREVARGTTRYYHLGRPSEWKLRWATEVAPLCTLRIYSRTPRGRAAHLLGPVLRGQLKRVRKWGPTPFSRTRR